MITKTMIFWHEVVMVIMIVVGSSVALPMVTIITLPANAKENAPDQMTVIRQTPSKLSTVSESIDQVDKNNLWKEQHQQNDRSDNSSKSSVTNNTVASAISNTPIINTQSDPADMERSTENVSEPNLTSFNVTGDRKSDDPKKQKLTNVVHFVKIVLFPLVQNDTNPNYKIQPLIHSQLSFGAPVNPSNSLVYLMRSPLFYQLADASANNSYMPKIVIVKSKRNAQPNITSIPPIQLLLNNMLNAFQYEPTDESIIHMDNTGNTQNVEITSKKPMIKTTTRTETINGHIVQINETTYNNGDINRNSFYHIKEIQLFPKHKNQKITSKNMISMTSDNAEVDKMETNEIKRDPFETFVIPNDVVVNKQDLMKKNSELVPLEDHYQTAEATYYAPNAPYQSQPATLSPSPLPGMIFGRPPPISLHNDILVNERVATQQHKLGVNAVLPPDVEILNFSGKLQTILRP